MNNILGFDFGTTNTLVATVANGEAVAIRKLEMTEPSTIAYVGTEVKVGVEAMDYLGANAISVYGEAVRSPKKYLADGNPVNVAGVPRSPIDMACEVIAHVGQIAKERLSSNRDRAGLTTAATNTAELDQRLSVVATIPIAWDGVTRRRLRTAFEKAHIDVVHFLHEPFAALYGYLRSQIQAVPGLRQHYQNKYLVVVDWGGGTLDVTVCQVQGDVLKQIISGGTNSCGGDLFDEELASAVFFRAKEQRHDLRDATLDWSASRNLVSQCEYNKRQIGRTDSYRFRGDWFPGKPMVDVSMSEAELTQVFLPLIERGNQLVGTLLRQRGLDPQMIELCLLTGGMSHLEMLRRSLQAKFGARLKCDDDGTTAIARGAALFAHDARTLKLATPVEIKTADASFHRVLTVDAAVPRSYEQATTNPLRLRCSDPSDGLAKIAFYTPLALETHARRRSLGTLSIPVQSNVKPFDETVICSAKLDSNLCVLVEAYGEFTNKKQGTEFVDLDFCAQLPVAR